MAIKLSSYYWFMNEYIVRSLEDKFIEQRYFKGELSDKDRTNLKSLVEKLDELKEDSHFQEGRPLISGNIAIHNVVELKDATSDPELAATYLNDIHKVVEKYWVPYDLYRRLGQCFEELNLQPPKDIENAVKFANIKLNTDRYPSGESMCWSNIKKYNKNPVPF